MRRILPNVLCLALLVGASACAPPAPPPPPAGPTPAEMVAAADALDRQFAAAFNKADVDAMMATYWNSPALISVGPEGAPTKGWDATKAGMVELFKAMPGAKFEITESHNDAHGDIVLGWGTWKLTMGPADKPQVIEGRYTDAKARRDGKWVYVMDHASVSLPPPPPTPVK